MKKEYNVKSMKLKRRGVLPALQKDVAAGHKVRITISLDKEIIDYFKAEAKNPGAFPYQTQINQALRRLLDRKIGGISEIDELKAELLKDPIFIRKLAKSLFKIS